MNLKLTNQLISLQQKEEEIETLFKVEPPLQSLEEHGFYGFLGVILRNKTIDKIQCHLCGKWFSILSTHLLRKHQITQVEYQKKFSLPLTFPLCSKGFSASHSKSCIEKKLYLNLNGKRNPQMARKFVKKEMNGYGRNSMAYLNSKGLCDEQIMKRFMIVSDLVGRNPSQLDLEQHDAPLWAAIRRRYSDSINEFRAKNGIGESNEYAARRFGTENIIACLRKFYRDYKRIPRDKDFRIGTPNSPTSITIRKEFGSWKRALSKAGLR